MRGGDWIPAIMPSTTSRRAGFIYIHAWYLLPKSEIITDENGNVTVKSEGRNHARVVLHWTQRGSEGKKWLL
jgi:hypothetical protein